METLDFKFLSKTQYRPNIHNKTPSVGLRTTPSLPHYGQQYLQAKAPTSSPGIVRSFYK